MEFISIFVPTLLKNVNTLKWRYVCHLKHITLFQMCTQLTSLSVVLFSEVNESLSLHYPLHLKTIEANSLPPLENWNYLTLLLQKLNVIAVGGGVHLNVFRTKKYHFPSLILFFSPMILITQFPPTNAHFHLYFIVPYTHQMFMNINVLSRDFDVFSSHWAFWGMCTLPYASNRFFF